MTGKPHGRPVRLQLAGRDATGRRETPSSAASARTTRAAKSVETTMPAHTTSRIFVVGGTGAQGLPVIGALVADKKYSVRALSRDATSRRANALLALGNVSILQGTF